MRWRSPAAISPTAHYTGEVWRRNGLSHPALSTWQGRALHTALRPPLGISLALGGISLEDFLLARHRLIDELLEEAVADARIGQVIEIAAGMSPRGLRLRERHPALVYVEADLPGMADRKRRALERTGAGHRVEDLDALADRGPQSLSRLAGDLDPDRGTAVISEGLLNYFPRASVEGIWVRIAAALRRFPRGLYVSDLHLAERNAGVAERAFIALLSAFVMGRVHLPFHDRADAAAALKAAGFERAVLHPGSEAGAGRGADRVEVIEAWVG